MELFVDGNSQGTFTMQGGTDLFLSIGDHASGQGANIIYDSVENGVVPEPSSAVLAVIAMIAGLFLLRKRRRTES